MHAKTNRTSTCHHSVSPMSTIIPFGRHDHIGLPRVTSYPHVDSSPETETIFNELQTRNCLDDTQGRKTLIGRGCRVAVYASGLRRRPECVHFRQCGLRDTSLCCRTRLSLYAPVVTPIVTSTHSGYICCSRESV